MVDWAIETLNLRKSFGHKIAVTDLTLQVRRGEVFGFLGPNGAGKSTSLKMLLGLVRPSGGNARVLGMPAGNPAALARIGFLPEHFRFHAWLPATQLLDFHARLYGMDAAARRARIPVVLEQVGLTEHANTQVANFSKGMVQRLGLAQAMLNTPELVFLDEPTSGLDPLGRRLVRSVIHDLAAQGTTVFLNSHLLGEVEATCERVAFIKKGVVQRTLMLNELAEGKVLVELRVDALNPALTAALNALPVTWQVRDPQNESDSTNESHADNHNYPPNAVSVTVTLTDPALLPILAERTVSSGAQLYALTPRHVSLEQLFLQIVGTEDSGQ